MVKEGYLTSNANSAWPFDENDPSFDLDVACLFADASVTVYPWEDEKVVVKNVKTEKGGKFSFKVSKTESKGGSVETECSGTVDPNKPYILVQPDAWCSFVLDSFQVLQRSRLNKIGPFPLSRSCLYARAKRVESFTLINGEIASQKITGDVKFVAGTNMYVGNDLSQASYAYSSAVASDKNGIVLSAVAGAGAGRVPCDPSNDVECTGITGNVIPDAQGDVVIEGDGCYQISPCPERNSVRIVGRCTACCQCKDYVDIGNRLAGQSQTLSGVYARLMSDTTTYNQYATKFNESLKVVSKDELLVRCVSMSQRTDAGEATSVHMDRSSSTDHVIRGSLNRGAAVLSIKNASVADVTCDIDCMMTPQNLTLASFIWPDKAGTDWSKAYADTYDVSRDACLAARNVFIPSGSGITVNLYGALANTQTASDQSYVYGKVSFRWKEGDDDKSFVKLFDSGQVMPT